MKVIKLIGSAVIFCLAATTLAQQVPANRSGKHEREDQLDPSPVNPAVDPDINKFLGDWRSSKPRTMYGNLVFRDILTRLDSKDPIHPVKRGAVLSWDHAISYVTLAPGATAKGRVESGDQQIFYTSGGTGKITVNGQAHDLKEGSGFVLFPEFSFEMTNAGKTPLEFYVRDEPIPPGRKPATDITVMNRFDLDRKWFALGTHLQRWPSGDAALHHSSAQHAAAPQSSGGGGVDHAEGRVDPVVGQKPRPNASGRSV